MWPHGLAEQALESLLARLSADNSDYRPTCHFPMQNDPKIRPNKSSAVNIPVISSSACCAARSSSATSSPARRCCSSRAAVSTHSPRARQRLEMTTSRRDAAVTRALKADTVLEVRAQQVEPFPVTADTWTRGGPEMVSSIGRPAARSILLNTSVTGTSRRQARALLVEGARLRIVGRSRSRTARGRRATFPRRRGARLRAPPRRPNRAGPRCRARAAADRRCRCVRAARRAWCPGSP